MRFGAILAGGRSTRFGREPKALARLAGVPVIEHVRRAMDRAGFTPHLITNDAGAYAHLGLAWRSDAIDRGGAACGLHAALRWAEEEGEHHALCVACDMPFLSTPLLEELYRRARSSNADVVVPESEGPLAAEPLCAVYSTSSIATVERLLAAGSVSLGFLLRTLHAERISLDEVKGFGDPLVLFLNVNTRAQLDAAATIVPATERGT